MASVIETTAVALRRGDTESNRNFVGVQGEVTVDLGNEQNGVLGVDTNVTLRVHNGVTRGGIPLARADMRNVTTDALARNRHLFDDKNLAYADLSNIETAEDPEAISLIKQTLTSYGMINDEQLQEEVSNLALRDMSNVLTSTLASGRGRGTNGNLAYADTSNINTVDLATYDLHNDPETGNLPLAYANLSNVDTTNITLSEEERPENINGPVIATNTFSNVSKETWQSSLFNPENELYLEQTINKDNEIPEKIEDILGNHYPSTSAVHSFVNTTIENGHFLKNDYTNGINYYPLYSNNKYNYELVLKEDSVLSGGTNFSAGNQYYIDKDLGNEEYLMNFIVTSIVGATGKISDIQPTIRIGKENLGDKEIILNVKDKPLKISLHAIPLNDELYIYNANIDDTEQFVTGSLNQVVYPEEDIILKRLVILKALDVTEDGTILTAEISPQYSTKIVTNTDPETELTFEVNPELGTASTIGTNASIKVYIQNAISPFAGGAGLAKTDLSNLLGMSEKDQFEETDYEWRIKHNENIPNVNASLLPSAKEYKTISNNGKVWEALVNTKNYIEQTSGIPNWKANTTYAISPYPSKVLYENNIYYCLEAHTSSETFDRTKWKLIGEDTYEQLINKNSDISLDTASEVKYPTNSAVVKYVKEQIDAVHTPGHYYGQVDIFVPTENDLPQSTESGDESYNGNISNYPEYTVEPYEGLTALVENYNNTNKPVIATYTQNAWTFEEITLQNGVYVYVLDLGLSYYNGPGNATWNDETNAFDIAPDKFQVPDGITLNLNSSTGAIQIVPALQTKLNYVDVSSSIQGSLDDIYDRLNNLDQSLVAMVIPNPQFFTGTGLINQQLVLTDNVAFDLYVNGVFQYPNTYTFDAETKTITLNFAVENTTENGIAVIYRGFRTLQQ